MRKRHQVIKSTVLLFVIVCVLLGSSSCSSNNKQQQGRYQLVVSPDDKDAYVIDTRTGQVWSRDPVSSYRQKIFYLPKLHETQESAAK